MLKVSSERFLRYMIMHAVFDTPGPPVNNTCILSRVIANNPEVRTAESRRVQKGPEGSRRVGLEVSRMVGLEGSKRFEKG